MNCQSFKNKIDEGVASAELLRHLEACKDCKTFQEERECLSALLKKLECVNAPANFEFALRAKLNRLPSAPSDARLWRRRFAFATPAFAAVAISAFALSNYNLFAPSPQSEPQRAAVVSQTPNVVAPSPTPSEFSMPSNSTVATTTPDSAIAQSPPNFAPRGNTRFVSNSDSPAKLRRAERKPRNLVRDIDESIQTKPDQALTKAQSVYPNAVDPTKAQKIPVADALTFFGIEISAADGNVKSVKANSEAAQKGIAAGDVVETVNGQKTVGGNLGNELKQVELDVVRKGARRKVVLTLKTDLPK